MSDTDNVAKGERITDTQLTEMWEWAVDRARRCIETPGFAAGIARYSKLVFALVELRDRRSWQDISTAPKDGSTVAVRGVMLVHHMQGAKFVMMPKDWRPDTPQTEWRLTDWRDAPAPSEQAKAVADTRQLRSEAQPSEPPHSKDTP